MPRKIVYICFCSLLILVFICTYQLPLLSLLVHSQYQGGHAIRGGRGSLVARIRSGSTQDSCKSKVQGVTIFFFFFFGGWPSVYGQIADDL